MSGLEVCQVVLARMKGFPPWPAFLAPPPRGVQRRSSYYVQFFGTHDFAWVAPGNITRYLGLTDNVQRKPSKAWTTAVAEMEASSVVCLLCPGYFSLEGYTSHLALKHRVVANRDWLVSETLILQEPEGETESVLKDDADHDEEVKVTSRASVLDAATILEIDNVIDNIVLSHNIVGDDPEKHRASRNIVKDILNSVLENTEEIIYRSSLGKLKNRNMINSKDGNSAKKCVGIAKDLIVARVGRDEEHKVEEAFFKTLKEPAPKLKLAVNNRFPAGKKSWYDGNTFSCSYCGHSTSSTLALRQHTKMKHRTSSVGKYTRTWEQYECLCCSTKILHDKKSLTEHIRTHFLSLSEYYRLYGKAERNKVKGIMRKGLEGQEDDVAHMDIDRSLVELHQDTSANYDINVKKINDNLSSVELSSNVSNNSKEEGNREKNNQDQIDNHRSKEDDKSSVYVCPFVCSFSTDHQGLQQGLAERHCLEEHGLVTQPGSRGWSRWRQLSIETQMETMFGEEKQTI